MGDLKNNKRPGVDNSQLWKYAGMVMQFFVSIGAAVFIGFKMDKWMNTKPWWASLLPLLVIAGIIIKVYRDTTGKK